MVQGFYLPILFPKTILDHGQALEKNFFLLISGFYFLKCGRETSRPHFHDPRPGKMMVDIRPKDKSKVTPANDQIHYPVRPGQFIFFNSL